MVEKNIENQQTDLQRQSWVSAAFLLIFMSVISKVLGFFREILIARNFGISSDVDAYFVAVSVPALIGGALGSSLGIALIPIYHKVRSRHDCEAEILLKNTFTFTAIVSLALMLIIYSMPAYVIKTIAPAVSETTMKTAVEMLRWLSLLIAGYAIFYVLCSVYNALHHFKMPALTELLSNVFIIASLLFLSSRIGIYALVSGFIAALLIVVVVLFIDLVRRRIISLSFNFKTSEFKELLYFTGPVLLFSLFLHVSVIIENFFASSLESGSIAALGYAKRLFDIIPTFLAMNIAKAIFPTISSLASEGRCAELRDLVTKLNRRIIVYFIPVTFIFIFFGADIVQVVFMRGQFNADAASLTTRVFIFYAPALVFSILLPIFFRLCYAFSDTKTPLIAAGVAVLIIIPANFFLTPVVGLVGIAFTDTVAVIVKISVLFVVVRKKLGGLNLKRLVKTLLFSIASGGTALVPFLFFKSSTLLGFIVSVAIYFMLYLALSHFLLREEIQAAWLSFKKIQKRSQNA